MEEFILPGKISSQLKVDIKDCYKILNQLEHDGVIKSCFLIVCPKCNEICGNYQTINNIPQICECRKCGNSMKDNINNSIVVYKKK